MLTTRNHGWHHVPGIPDGPGGVAQGAPHRHRAGGSPGGRAHAQRKVPGGVRVQAAHHPGAGHDGLGGAGRRRALHLLQDFQ